MQTNINSPKSGFNLFMKYTDLYLVLMFNMP